MTGILEILAFAVPFATLGIAVSRWLSKRRAEARINQRLKEDFHYLAEVICSFRQTKANAITVTPGSSDHGRAERLVQNGALVRCFGGNTYMLNDRGHQFAWPPTVALHPINFGGG